jgi:hypothetical protein
MFQVVLATVTLMALTPGTLPAQAQDTSRYFSETGYTVGGRFLDYWTTHGGLDQQGYPISDEMQEVSATDGKVYTDQYFERAVFEKHPENQPPNDVLLSLLGLFLYHQKYPEGAPNQVPNSDEGAQLFKETGHTVGGIFLIYWTTHGGLAQQGYPISDEFSEKSDLDGKTYKVQYFQRAVFESHPENAAPYNVLLSQLGTFRYKSEYGGAGAAPVPPSSGPTPTTSPAPISQPTGRYEVTATVDNPNPAQNSNVTVTGTLTRDGQGVKAATMDTVWHYKTRTVGCSGVTDSNGVASCTRYISGAAKGYTIVIDITLKLPDGGTVQAETRFTPR